MLYVFIVGEPARHSDVQGSNPSRVKFIISSVALFLYAIQSNSLMAQCRQICT